MAHREQSVESPLKCKKRPQLEKNIPYSKSDHDESRQTTHLSDSASSTESASSNAQTLNEGSLVFRFCDRNEKTMRYLNKEPASFMWSQFLVDVLKRFPVHENTYEEMRPMCVEWCRKRSVPSNMVDEFINSPPHDAIKWYSKNCFLYRLLNEALRKEDIDDLYSLRGFIIVLCSEIEQQRQYLDSVSVSSGKCYRGQVISEWELSRLKESIGQLVSVNSFFSASLDENVANVFAGHDASGNEKCILFEIAINSNLRHTAFALIQSQSHHPDEEEILFSLTSAFKVIEICEEKDKAQWHVYLEATDEGYTMFEKFHQFMTLDIESPTTEIVFGRLITYMGQYEKAIKYFALFDAQSNGNRTRHHAAIQLNKSICYYHMCKYQEARKSLKAVLRMLKTMHISLSDPFYLRCRFYLANVYMFTNELQLARCIFQKTLQSQRRTLPENHIHIGDTLRAIGKLRGNESGYHEALPYREEALKIYQLTLPLNHPKLINALHDLAGCYEAVGQFQKALDILSPALSMLDYCVTDDHSSRAKVLRSIGINEQALGNWQKAFEYYCKAYSIWMLQFPGGHVFTSFCLNKMGEVYRLRKQYREALACQLYALDMRTHLFPANTPQPCHSLGLTYLDMGDNRKAVQTLILARHYWRRKTTDASNIDLNYVESCLATAYSHNGQYKFAHRTVKKVLGFQRSTHSQGDPSIGITLHHMASNLMRMQKYHWAMRCYQESLGMLSKFVSENHFEISMVREKMMTLEWIINNSL